MVSDYKVGCVFLARMTYSRMTVVSKTVNIIGGQLGTVYVVVSISSASSSSAVSPVVKWRWCEGVSGSMLNVKLMLFLARFVW